MSKVIYDRGWADGVLQEFEDQYPGTYQEVNSLLQINRQQVVILLQSDPIRWRLYKKLVKARAHGFRTDNEIREKRREFQHKGKHPLS